jgi:hypothetical protein
MQAGPAMKRPDPVEVLLKQPEVDRFLQKNSNIGSGARGAAE